MATLTVLTNIYETGAVNSPELFDKVVAAVLINAEEVRIENVTVPNHANRLAWAKEAFQAPRTKAQEMFGAMIASAQVATPAITEAQITGASDQAIIDSVAAAIDIFADGAGS